MGKNDVFFAIIILKSTLFAEIAVLEAEEVEHAVNADGVDALLGICHNARLCMECYAQTGFAKHWPLAPSPTAIVCARLTFSTCAMSLSSSALRCPSTISPT